MIASRTALAPAWILGSKRDLGLFILTPLLIVPCIYALRNRVPAETLGVYVLGLGGFGHHLPGFIRAYSDADLFRRFRLRLTLVPALLIALCGLYSYLNLNAAVFATLAWGTWHGAMQINGFMRIYDAKAGSIRPVTAKLDWLMCIAWFGLAILHAPAKQFSLVTQFYVSGGPLIPPALFGALRAAWDLFAVAASLLFAANAYRQSRAGTPPALAKLAIMLSGFAFWWFCMVTVNNLILGLIMWEIFHDVQYNALVWAFQRRRAERDPHIGRFGKILFGQGPAALASYLALILGYGCIGVYASFADVNLPEKAMMGDGASPWLLRITLASALLHFYFDGFIWRVRERKTRQDLGMAEGGLSAQDTGRRGRYRHALKWAFFIVPMGLLGVSQYRGWNAGFDSQIVNLAEAIPGSWMADFLSGTYYKGQGRFDEAERHYRLAVQSNPDFAVGHLFLGDILYKEGSIPEAIEQYRLSVSLDSSNQEGKVNLAFLYLKGGQPVLAVEQFQAALAADPENPQLNFGMASAMLQQKRLPEAEAFLEKTLRVSPGHSGALNYFGMIHEIKGDSRGALEYYRRALQADSTNAAARENLATLSKSMSVPPER